MSDMTEIDVPDWVVEAAEDARVHCLNAVTAYGSAGVDERYHMAMKAALTAALGAWVVPALDEYQRLRDGVGGCTDGGCVIKRPTGMHTNGGCKCWQDKIKAQRMMRAGQKLFDTLRQEKPE